MNEQIMTYDPEDPRLCAYVLGELEPAERAAVEALLARSEEARRALAEIRETVAALEAGCAAEVAAAPAAGASVELAVTPAAAASQPPSSDGAITLSKTAGARPPRWLALAACVLLGAGGTLVVTHFDDLRARFGGAGSSGSGAGAEGNRRAEQGAPLAGEPAGMTAPSPMPVIRLDSPITFTFSDPVDPATLSRLEVAVITDPGAASSFVPPITYGTTVTGNLQAQGHFARTQVFPLPPGVAVDQALLALVSANPTSFGYSIGGFDELPWDPASRGPGTESYDRIVENPFKRALDDPLSTFSIDVDTASYANLRRFLTQGTWPPPDAVRIEEMVNYFRYRDRAPRADEPPFAVTLEAATCPWTKGHRILRIALKGREILPEQRPRSNLVFLIDVSGSMQPANKLPLLKQALGLLVDALGENDRVAMVVYAGASGLALAPTSCDKKEAVQAAIENLEAGGSTNGGAGIELAYGQAVQGYVPGGINRVILCTDGDFNVGVSSRGDLVRLIEEKRQSGVFLSVLGFGDGNLQDSQLEELADKGNGHYAYIDSLEEARKVLVREMGSTLQTIAKDVKIQVEFNPTRVLAWRLLGYENRVLAAQDFNDDKKDAGEIGAGAGVVALYEVVPAGEPAAEAPSFDPLRYQRPRELTGAAASKELGLVKLRWKDPEASTSQLLEVPFPDSVQAFDASSEDLRFTAAVAAFGMTLRRSQHLGSATLAFVLELAEGARGADPHGDRQGFVDLVRRALELGAR